MADFKVTVDLERINSPDLGNLPERNWRLSTGVALSASRVRLAH